MNLLWWIQRIITQISVMNSFINWIFVNWHIWNSEFIGELMVLYKALRSSSIQSTCNSHALQSSLPFHHDLTIFVSTGEFVFQDLSSLNFPNLNSDLHLSCICVGITLQSTAGWKAFFSWIFLSESPRHYLGKIRCYAFLYYYLPSPAWKPSEHPISPSVYCSWCWSVW